MHSSKVRGNYALCTHGLDVRFVVKGNMISRFPAELMWDTRQRVHTRMVILSGVIGVDTESMFRTCAVF